MVNNSYYHSNTDYSYFYKPEAQEDLIVSNQNNNEDIVVTHSIILVVMKLSVRDDYFGLSD